MKKILCAILGMTMCLGLAGCQESDTANHNLRVDANNFKISRKVVALNTRTNEPLFSVEGKISIETDSDGDLNVTIKTGKDKYKLFYAHLSKDVTYTSIQTDSVKENPYGYKITFFPAKETIEHGMINVEDTNK